MTRHWRQVAFLPPLVALVVLGTNTAWLTAQGVVISGTVTSAVSGNRIAAVSVIHAERVVTVTDSDGAFVTPPVTVDGGEITLVFRRLGFAPHAVTLPVPAGVSSVTADIGLHPLPTVLEEIVVDGSPITIRNPGLIGFYERRAAGIGRYLTQMEIDRAKSWDLTPYLELRLRVQNLTSGCGAGDVSVVYLDGIRWMSMETVNRLLAPTQVGGIEVYPRDAVHRLPPEFIPAGPFCTVTMVWTREPLPPSGALLGVYAAPEAAGGGPRETFFGGQLIFPLRRASTLQLHVGYDASRSSTGDRWHGTLAISFRPLGYDSPWYAGGGGAISKPQGSPDVRGRPVILSGLFGRIGALRPFTEARLIGTDLLVLAGLNIHLGPN